MPKQEQLNKQARDYIVGLRNTAQQLWIKACEFDGIPADSKFVVFSDENKFAKFYGIAMGQMFDARQQFADGGYVGLRIQQGRAK